VDLLHCCCWIRTGFAVPVGLFVAGITLDSAADLLKGIVASATTNV